jgi:hypothetical protein
MARRNSKRSGKSLGIALAIVACCTTLPLPAGAQFFGFPYGYGYGPRPTRPPPSRGFFSFPFMNGDQFYRPPAPTETYKAPSPRKQETPPANTVVVVGDSMADWLAYGLEEIFSDSPELGIERKIRPTSGLIRYDPKNDTLDWSQAIKDALATEKPSAIVVMLGLSDRLALRDKVAPRPGAAPAPPAAGQAAPTAQGQSTTPAQPAAPPADSEQPAAAATSEPQHPGGSYDFRTDKWAELYAKRIDDMIAALKSKGVPVLWVGLPAVYGTRSTSDMSYLDELYRARAERAGIVYVDIWDGFVDENGRYVSQGPDFEGQTRRLRAGDGVHFTKAGAVKLAQFVAQDLRRVMSSHMVPVALPAPDEGTPSKPAGPGPRPIVGPVVPLTAESGSDSNELLGAGAGRTTPTNTDPVAVRVLSNGNAIAAPSGRADDFSWPRRGADGAADAEIDIAPPPPAAAVKPTTGRNDAKKVDDAKSNSRSAPSSPTATRTTPRADLDGGRRPPSGGF